MRELVRHLEVQRQTVGGSATTVLVRISVYDVLSINYRLKSVQRQVDGRDARSCTDLVDQARHEGGVHETDIYRSLTSEIGRDVTNLKPGEAEIKKEVTIRRRVVRDVQSN